MADVTVPDGFHMVSMGVWEGFGLHLIQTADGGRTIGLEHHGKRQSATPETWEQIHDWLGREHKFADPPPGPTWDGDDVERFLRTSPLANWFCRCGHTTSGGHRRRFASIHEGCPKPEALRALDWVETGTWRAGPLPPDQRVAALIEVVLRVADILEGFGFISCERKLRDAAAKALEGRE